MTLTRKQVEELRDDAGAAASELLVSVPGDVLIALLDAWEEQERIKLGDISRIMRELPSVIDPAKLRRPLTTADEDRIVARCLREVAEHLFDPQPPFAGLDVPPLTPNPMLLRQRAAELDDKERTAWRPAQEERDGQTRSGRPAVPAVGMDDSSELQRGSVGNAAVAGPVTPDAAGAGGVRGAMELVQAWPCVQQCDDGVIPVQVGPDEWAPQQCQFCDERKRVLAVLAILAALPEGELIDAGEYPAHMHYGSPAVAFPVIPTPTVGTYRIFLQREEVW